MSSTDNKIFIHIPKTGGTTLNCAINKTEWQTKPDFNYRHILYQTKRSNSKDIFQPENFEKYAPYDIFSMVRHPADRIVSEYFFIRDRAEFMGMIKKTPRNLKEFIINKQTQNYMVGFLVGKLMYDPAPPKKLHLDKVLHAIDTLPIHVGIFERFEESLFLFEKELGIKWPKKMKAKRITLNRPELKDVSDEIKELAVKHNPLDMALYNHCKATFETKLAEHTNIKSYNVTKNKYDYVLVYAKRFPILTLFLTNKSLISANKAFFEELQRHLMIKMRIKDGYDFLASWNISFLNTLKNTKGIDSLIITQMEQIIKETEPLETIECFAKIIDNWERKTSLNLQFNPELLVHEKKKGGFWSKIFNK